MSETMKFLQLIAHYLNFEDILCMKLRTDIASMLLNERHERGLTQAQLADLIESTQAELSKWENGDSNLTMKTLVRICAKLDLIPSISFEKRDMSLAISGGGSDG